MSFKRQLIALIALVFCAYGISNPNYAFCINAEAWEKVNLTNIEIPYFFRPMCLELEHLKGNIISDLYCHKRKIIERECQKNISTENVHNHCIKINSRKEADKSENDHKKRNEFILYDVSMLPYGIKSMAIRKEEKNNKMFYTLVFDIAENSIHLSDIVTRYGLECGKIIADKNFNKNFVLSYDYKQCFKMINIEELASPNKQLYFLFQNPDKTLSAVIWVWEGIVLNDKSKEPVKPKKKK